VGSFPETHDPNCFSLKGLNCIDVPQLASSFFLLCQLCILIFSMELENIQCSILVNDKIRA